MAADCQASRNSRTGMTVALDMEQRMPTFSALAPSMRGLAKRLKLRHAKRDQLRISRRRNGEAWTYHMPDGEEITNEAVIKRLSSLAMPPAYEEVFYALDERAHLQAIGRDAAGRLQYRYHPDWEKVREAAKAQRLAELVEVLPKIRRTVTQHLGASEPTRAFALAAIIELVSGSAIRPGSEEYTKKHGSRGAATLLKSNVRVSDDMITLVFRGKSGKDIRKEFKSPRLGHRDRDAQETARPPSVSVSRRRGHRAARQRARRECVPPRDGGLQHLAQGFSYAVRVGIGARALGAHRSRRERDGEAQAGARSGAPCRRRAGQYAGGVPPFLCA
jgi:hypothetical protein